MQRLDRALSPPTPSASRCLKSGALGPEADRVGIYQVVPFTPAMGEIIMRGGNQIDIEAEPCKSGVADSA